MQDVRKKWGEMENHWPVKLQWHRFIITGTINNRFSTTLFFLKLVLTIPTFLQSPFFYYWSRRSALSLCKEKWILEREVMVHIVMAAQWTITNLQVMQPTRSLTYTRIAAELDYMPGLLVCKLITYNISIKHLHVNNVWYNAETNMTLWTKPCHSLNLNE